jgi:two-component system NtrC family response regulator
MPAHVVLVHDDQRFLSDAETALVNAGYKVKALDNPNAVLMILDTETPVDLLITRVQFGSGKKHGISLARMARTKRPGIKILFAAMADFEEHASGVGEFLVMPASMSELVRKVANMVRPDQDGKPA